MEKPGIRAGGAGCCEVILHVARAYRVSFRFASGSPATRTIPGRSVRADHERPGAIQFGVTHFRRICRVCYRVLTASPPMRLLPVKPAEVLLSHTGSDTIRACGHTREGL